MENKKYDLQELLRKSPTEITHEEMMFVLENMSIEDLVKAAVEKKNQEFIESVEIKDEQKN